MAFKLTKEQTTARDALAGRLEEAREKLDSAVVDFNDTITAARGVLQEEIDAYNGLLSEAKTFADEVAQEWENEFEEKSERWQEGDTGQAVRELIEAWQNVDFEGVDIDTPDPEVSFDAEVHSELLTDLPTEKE